MKNKQKVDIIILKSEVLNKNTVAVIHDWAKIMSIRILRVRDIPIAGGLFSEDIILEELKNLKNSALNLKAAMERVRYDFIVINMEKKDIMRKGANHFVHFAKNIGEGADIATVSPGMYNTNYPYIKIQNEYYIKKKLKALGSRNGRFTKNIPGVISEEMTGNPYITFFKLCIFQELGGFSFNQKYVSAEEVVFDYFYKVQDAYYKNSITKKTAIYQLWERKTYLEDVESIQKYVLKRFTGKYLSYEPPFQFQSSHEFEFTVQLNYRKTFRGKITNKNLLFIVPSSIFVNGLNTHVDDLIQNIANTNIYLLEPSFAMNECKYFELAHYFNGIKVTTQKIPYLASMHISNTSSAEYKKMLETVIVYFKIDYVHAHIMALGHTLDAPAVCKKHNIPIAVSLHDLYYLSGEFTQKNPEIEYNSSALLDKYAILDPQRFFDHWHVAVQEMFDNVDQVIGFSNSTINIYGKRYKLPAKTEVIAHGYDFKKRYTCGVMPKAKQRLRAVFFGRVEREKGSDILYHLIKTYPHIDFHILGVINDPRFRKKFFGRNVKIYGKYQKENLPILLNKIKPNFTILPSIWDETFAFTLTEAYLYGIYPIVSPKGALKERVEQTGIGYVLDSLDYADLERAINEVSNFTQQQWETIYSDILKIDITTVAQMVQCYEKLYGLNSERNINFHVFVEGHKEAKKAFLLENLSLDWESKQDLLQKLYQNSMNYNKLRKSRGVKIFAELRRIRKKFTGEE